MKIALSYLKWLIIGIVSLISMVILAVWVIFVSTGSLPPSRHSIIATYKSHTDAFDQIRAYIDASDLSAYPKDDGKLPNFIIRRESVNNEATCYAYVNADQHYALDIEDENVRRALDMLFQKTKLQYIVQTKDAANRSVYFGYKGNRGVVFSRSGFEPADQPVESIYSYKRINDYWFYWVGPSED